MLGDGGERYDTELSRILDNQRIVPLFQPVADALDQKTVCYEVFSRGVFPLEAPLQLFAAARSAGLLWEAEDAARKAALRKIAFLVEHTGCRFFLNIYPEVLCDERSTAEYLLQILDVFSLGPEHVGLEITSADCEAPRTLERKAAELSSAGIVLSIDDVDPSKESHIRLLEAVKPLYAKLPRGLVHDLDRYTMGQQNIRLIMGKMQETGTSLIAKGVEDGDELGTLLSLGVRLIQGYLVARPEAKPPAVLEDFESFSLRAASALLISNKSSSDCSVGELAEKPMVLEKGKHSCEEMDGIFQRNTNADHVVVTENDKPVGLVTRTSFYLNTGGRFGYSVYQRETVDAVAKKEPMITGDAVRVTEVSDAAMRRDLDSIYDPVIVVDWAGKLIGTVTVRQLLDRTISAERNNSGALDPVTGLPGNVSVRRKLMDSIQLKTFTLATTNINGFRTFNLVHGFENGDRMINLLADLLKKHVRTFVRDAFIGHLGYDRFAVVSFMPIPRECLEAICREFDRRSSSLFYTWEEQESGEMELQTRSGSMAAFPLCTVSVAVTSSDNFTGDNLSPALVIDSGNMLLKKLGRECSAERRSKVVYDNRVRKARFSQQEQQ